MRVSIIGTGYVGLTTGVALAYLGHEVIGIDKDETKLALLEQGKSPIHEPGLVELLRESRERIRFTKSVIEGVANADVIMIAVGTPSKVNGEADISYVEDAVQEVALGLQPDGTYTIVVKSTVPIGTSHRVVHVVRRVLHERGIRAQVFFASNPEFLREGMALRDTLYPDRIVVGSEDPEAIEILRRLYRPILEQTFTPPRFLPRPEGAPLPPYITTDPTSAEMIKYASNAFLAIKISFINEIAGLCEKVGADVTEVARGIGLDSRIGLPFLKAGIGWGGSCLPKDTAALLAIAKEYGYTMPITRAAREVNERQRHLVIEKLQSVLKVIRGRTIGVLGLAFKPNTDDVREAPSLSIIRMLSDLGAHVRAHDPIAIANAQQALVGLDVEFCKDPYAVAVGADALVLMTEWDMYRHLDFHRLAKQMRVRLLIDGRNLYVPAQIKAAGFTYMGIGR